MSSTIIIFLANGQCHISWNIKFYNSWRSLNIIKLNWQSYPMAIGAMVQRGKYLSLTIGRGERCQFCCLLFCLDHLFCTTPSPSLVGLTMKAASVEQKGNLPEKWKFDQRQNSISYLEFTHWCSVLVWVLTRSTRKQEKFHSVGFPARQSLLW